MAEEDDGDVLVLVPFLEGAVPFLEVVEAVKISVAVALTAAGAEMEVEVEVEVGEIG